MAKRLFPNAFEIKTLKNPVPKDDIIRAKAAVVSLSSSPLKSWLTDSETAVKLTNAPTIATG